MGGEETSACSTFRNVKWQRCNIQHANISPPAGCLQTPEMHHAAATTISFNPPSVFLPVGIKFRQANWIVSHRADCRNTTELQMDICFFNPFGNIVCVLMGMLRAAESTNIIW